MWKYLHDAFCDNGLPSSSRLLSAACTLASIFCIVFYTFKNHLLPDATAAGGLAAFSTSHYAANIASKMFGKNQTPVDPNAHVPDPNVGH